MSSPLRAVVVFFLVTCLFTALAQAPFIMGMRANVAPSDGVMLLTALGSAGPTLVALALAALFGGRAEIRGLFRRGARPTLPLSAIALGHSFAAHMIATGALMVVGAYTAGHLAYPPLKPEQIAIAIVAPLGEEFGWRGYALPRLQQVMRPVYASAFIGVVWAVWHVPTFFIPGGGDLSTLAYFIPLMVAGSIIYTWLWNAGGGSMALVVLAHLGIHLDNVSRGELMGDGATPLVSTMVVLAIFATVLVATGRLRADTAVTSTTA